MPSMDFFSPPPPVEGLTDVGDKQKKHLEMLSEMFGMPNRFESGSEAFQQGIASLGEAAKRDPRLTPIVASAMRILQGTAHDVPMPRRHGDSGVSNLPQPGGRIKVKGA